MEKMDKLMNETAVAEFLGVSLACVRRWRLFGDGPAYRKVGPLVRYRPEAVNEWFDSQPSGGNGHRYDRIKDGKGRRAAGRRPPARSKAQSLASQSSAA